MEYNSHKMMVLSQSGLDFEYLVKYVEGVIYEAYVNYRKMTKEKDIGKSQKIMGKLEGNLVQVKELSMSFE